jgi:hypothetical protein
MPQQQSDKTKAFSLGREMNQTAKKYEPGRGNESEFQPRLAIESSPDADTQARQGSDDMPTPSPSREGKRFYGNYSPSGPVLNKQQTSPDGATHNFTVSRAQSSFTKVPLGGEDHGDGPESPFPSRVRNSPTSKSPYAPGSAVKKPVKSLVVSI